MRAIGLPAKVAAACAAAVALLASLALPWYGAIPASTEPLAGGLVSGPLGDGAAALTRWLSRDGGRTGWELAGRWDTVLACLAAVAFVSALLCLLPATEHAARALLQLAALGSVGIVVARILVRPAGVEPRSGLLAALGLALLLAIVASGIAASKLRRRPAPTKRYGGTAAPVPYESGRSTAPPRSR